MKKRLSAPFGGDPRVIRPLIRIRDPGESLVHNLHDMTEIIGEPVGEGEDEHHQYLLVRGIDLENVAADALRRP